MSLKSFHDHLTSTVHSEPIGTNTKYVLRSVAFFLNCINPVVTKTLDGISFEWMHVMFEREAGAMSVGNLPSFPANTRIMLGADPRNACSFAGAACSVRCFHPVMSKFKVDFSIHSFTKDVACNL